MLGLKRRRKEDAEVEGLYTGMRVEVLNLANRMLFIGKVTVVKNSVIQINEENGQDVPWVEYNTRIKIRGFQQDGSTIAIGGYVCGSTDTFWRVDRLGVLQKEELRNFYRQTVDLPGTVLCVNQLLSRNVGRMDDAQGITSCTVVNLSGGGAGIRCSKDARFQTGDWLFLSVNDPLQEDERLNYTCCVRRVVEHENSFEYGCEFDGLTEAEQERVLKIVMTIQQRELRARRRNEE